MTISVAVWRALRIALVSVLASSACTSSGGGGDTDAGSALPPSDASDGLPEADLEEPSDADPATDTGEPGDADPEIDSGEPSDAGPEEDTASGDGDGGPPHDAALDADADEDAADGESSCTEAGAGALCTCGEGDASAGSACPRRMVVAAGSLHTCAILESHTLKCWGNGRAGQLGLGNTEIVGDVIQELGEALPNVDLGSGRTATAVAAGNRHSCALLDTGAIKCWGENSIGQLGLGDTDRRGDVPARTGDGLPAIDLGPGVTATFVAVGDNSTCAILTDGSLRCWGDNGSGQLGLGDTQHRGDQQGEMGTSLPRVELGAGAVVQTVVVGARHACALLVGGSVKCWGSNGDGELGLGDMAARGGASGQMGDSLPAVDLGTSRTARMLASHSSHTCALLDDGNVKCWGWNGTGQLGVGDRDDRGDAASEMGDDLPAVDLGAGRTALAIAAGASHSCAVLDDQSVKCWGSNVNGQLGLQHTIAPHPGEDPFATRGLGDHPSELGDALPTLDLGSGVLPEVVVAGIHHSCVLLQDRSLKCWGWNAGAQLGVGGISDRGVTPDSMGDDLPPVALGARLARP